MIANAIEIEGTLHPDVNLILDEKPALPPGRVRVALQAIGNGPDPGSDVLAVLNVIRSAQKAREHAPRTREEIDAAIAAMRGEDEERMQAIERLHEECQRPRRAESSAEKS